MSVSVDASPHTFTLQRDKAALIIIDVQKDFMLAGGFGESLGNDISLLSPIIKPLNKTLNLWRFRGLPVIHTLEAHLDDLSDCPPAKLNRGNPSLRIGDEGPMGRILIRHESGNDILDELTPIEGEKVLYKPGKGAFYNTDLMEHLKTRGIEQLIFAGVTTEVCVQTSMREANDRGFECLLLEDCTASYFPEFRKSTIDMITAQGGIVGWTCSSEQLIQALGTEEYPSPEDPRWTELRPGVEILPLVADGKLAAAAADTEQIQCAFLKYQAGASVPTHIHGGTEIIHVLKGSQSDERGEYSAGRSIINSKGTAHSVTSAEGCLILIYWVQPVEFA